MTKIVHRLRRCWYRKTHFSKAITYDPPERLPGSYFSVSGMMITGEKRWYRVAHRILWGQQPTALRWW